MKSQQNSSSRSKKPISIDICLFKLFAEQFRKLDHYKRQEILHQLKKVHLEQKGINDEKMKQQTKILSAENLTQNPLSSSTIKQVNSEALLSVNENILSQQKLTVATGEKSLGGDKNSETIPVANSIPDEQNEIQNQTIINAVNVLQNINFTIQGQNKGDNVIGQKGDINNITNNITNHIKESSSGMEDEISIQDQESDSEGDEEYEVKGKYRSSDGKVVRTYQEQVVEYSDSSDQEQAEEEEEEQAEEEQEEDQFNEDNYGDEYDFDDLS